MTALRSHACTFAFSALGMLLAHQVAERWRTPVARAEGSPGVVSAREIELVDAQGRRQILMATSGEGSPGIWFFDKDGKVRLSLGVYGDNTAFIVLSDAQGRAVQIFRTMGPESAPFLVMKAQGRDRIVLGLSGEGQDPFLVHYDAQGRKQTAFGTW
jgi:hypothetical protein